MELKRNNGVKTNLDLKKDSMEVWHVAIMGMVAIGPAASVGLNFGFVASFSGKAIALVFVGALLVMLLNAHTLTHLTRKVVSAGSAFSFVTEGIGPRTGFVVGWVYVLSYIAFSAGGMAVFGGWADAYSKEMFGIGISTWFPFMLLALFVISYTAYKGIRPSIRLSAIIVFVEMILILALAIWVTLVGDRSIEPFQISSSPTGLNGIGVAMVYGILSMVGFETAATYSEELTESKKNMGRALYLALIVPGLFYILAGYSMAIGYPNFSVIVDDPTPAQTLAQAFWGNLGNTAIVVAILTSTFGFAMGSFNALVRLLYSLGKSGVFPSLLGKVHAQNETPHISILWCIAIVILFATPLSLVVGPFELWGYYGFILGLGLLIVYIMNHVSVYSLYKRKYISEYSSLKHFALPFLGILILLFPIWETVYPLQEFPYNLFPFIMAGWIIIGIIIAVVLSKKNPEKFDLATEAIDDDSLSDDLK